MFVCLFNFKQCLKVNIQVCFLECKIRGKYVYGNTAHCTDIDLGGKEIKVVTNHFLLLNLGFLNKNH